MSPNEFKIMHVNLAMEFHRMHPEWALHECRTTALTMLNACGVVADEPDPCETSNEQVIDALSEALRGMLDCDNAWCTRDYKEAWKERARAALKLAKESRS